jgi:hypothetical protein
MCDGSVHFIDENIACNQSCSLVPGNLQTWEYLMAAGDGNAIDANTW